jgi:hypothetical protein
LDHSLRNSKAVADFRLTATSDAQFDNIFDAQLDSGSLKNLVSLKAFLISGTECRMEFIAQHDQAVSSAGCSVMVVADVFGDLADVGQKLLMRFSAAAR